MMRQLKIQPGSLVFHTEDGKPFFWLGDTAWAAPGRARAEDWRDYVRTRAAQGFSVVQMNALPQYDAAKPVDLAATPFEKRADGGRDFDRPVASYFKRLRGMVGEANQAGLVAGVVAFWFDVVPGGRLWTVDNPVRMTARQGKAYLKTLLEAMEGLSVVWILAGDDTFERPETRQFYREMGEALSQWDAPRRPVTLHPAWLCDHLFAEDAWIDFSMVQSSHSDAWQNAHYERAEQAYRLSPGRPLVNGEICYEGAPGFDFGHAFDAGEVRRAFFWSLFSGSLAGVTYGADGVWGWGEDVLGKLALPGAADLCRAKGYLERHAWHTLRPAQARLVSPTPRRVPVAEGESLLMAYVPHPMIPTQSGFALDTRGFLGRDAFWWNPVSGEEAFAARIEADATRFSPPEDADFLLVIR
jgi:hypothetical protein